MFKLSAVEDLTTPDASPLGLFLAASGSRRFVYFTELRSFADARLRCQQDHMELAVVRNAQDQAELIQALGGPIQHGLD